MKKVVKVAILVLTMLAFAIPADAQTRGMRNRRSKVITTQVKNTQVKTAAAKPAVKIATKEDVEKVGEAIAKFQVAMEARTPVSNKAEGFNAPNFILGLIVGFYLAGPVCYILGKNRFKMRTTDPVRPDPVLDEFSSESEGGQEVSPDRRIFGSIGR
ncbi:MAG: hypothetical protein KW793_02205 [Candidatus Doudnabacteria bacterium]|nr:hypothetical protein [Candidatus Doudnabacteria bacterium]